MDSINESRMESMGDLRTYKDNNDDCESNYSLCKELAMKFLELSEIELSELFEYIDRCGGGENLSRLLMLLEDRENCLRSPPRFNYERPTRSIDTSSKAPLYAEDYYKPKARSPADDEEFGSDEELKKLRKVSGKKKAPIKGRKSRKYDDFSSDDDDPTDVPSFGTDITVMKTKAKSRGRPKKSDFESVGTETPYSTLDDEEYMKRFERQPRKSQGDPSRKAVSKRDQESSRFQQFTDVTSSNADDESKSTAKCLIGEKSFSRSFRPMKKSLYDEDSFNPIKDIQKSMLSKCGGDSLMSSEAGCSKSVAINSGKQRKCKVQEMIDDIPDFDDGAEDDPENIDDSEIEKLIAQFDISADGYGDDDDDDDDDVSEESNFAKQVRNVRK